MCGKYQQLRMNRLVTYNSKEGELINKQLKNTDLTKLVESFLFNDAYIRVTLPLNVSPKTKQYANMNTILNYDDFTAFYAFHYEKQEAQTTTNDEQLQTRVNTSIQKLVKLMTSDGLTVLDHYVDFRFDPVMLSVMYTESNDESGPHKIVIKDVDISFKVRNTVAPTTKSWLSTALVAFAGGAGVAGVWLIFKRLNK